MVKGARHRSQKDFIRTQRKANHKPSEISLAWSATHSPSTSSGRPHYLVMEQRKITQSGSPTHAASLIYRRVRILCLKVRSSWQLPKFWTKPKSKSERELKVVKKNLPFLMMKCEALKKPGVNICSEWKRIASTWQALCSTAATISSLKRPRSNPIQLVAQLSQRPTSRIISSISLTHLRC